MKKSLEILIAELEDAVKYIDGFPGEYYAGQEVVYKCVIERATELLNKEQEVQECDASKA